MKKLLSTEGEPPLDQLIIAGIVPKLVSFLSDKLLQFKPRSIFVIVSFGSSGLDRTEDIIKETVQILIEMLSCECHHVSEKVVHALGNIAGKDKMMRNKLVSNGILEPLLNLAKSVKSVPFLRCITFTVKNLFKDPYPLPYPFICNDVISQYMPTICQLIQHSDSEILSNVCMVVNNMTEAYDDYQHGLANRISCVIETGVSPHLVRLLGAGDVKVVIPAIQSLSNIMSGYDNQGPILKHLLSLPMLPCIMATYLCTI